MLAQPQSHLECTTNLLIAPRANQDEAAIGARLSRDSITRDSCSVMLRGSMYGMAALKRPNALVNRRRSTKCGGYRHRP